MTDASTPTDGATAPVHLVFPPMVESNFGSLYPAPAVLAGFLAAHGVESSQEDLNESFAEYLLAPETARALGAGLVPGVSADSLCAAVARWSNEHRDQLIDPVGRHHFGPDAPYGWAMEILAQPFSVDPDTGVLAGEGDADTAAFYQAFYSWTGTAERIGDTTALVGISAAMGPQLLPALLLAAHVKAARPSVRVVLGGPAVSLMSSVDLDVMLRSNASVDCIVRYDGEFPLLELARQAVAGHWDPESVPGASCLTDDGVRHVPPGVGPNLNQLPRPRYSKAALARLASPTLSITQARGCYWGKCDYCDFVELYEGSAPFRGRHPDSFTDEVEWLAGEFGIRRFNFVTESIPPAFARRMSRAFLDRGLDVVWNSFAMVDRRFDRELLESMVASGCEFLVIGLETMVTRVLKLVHKSADREENIRFLQDARDVGMPLRVNLIPDLPSTTYEEALAALGDMERLADCVDSVSVFPFEATRSSNVGRAPDQFGLLPLSTSDAIGQSQYALNHLHNADPAMTPEQRSEVHRRYRDFARQIATRSTLPPSSFKDDLHPGALLRVPIEELDVLDTGEKLVCTHMGSRERLSLPGAAARILQPHLNGKPFVAGRIPGARRPDGVPKLAERLIAARVLVPAAEREGLVDDTGV
ncbi:radical SAM protein [Streptomyces sp. NBC_01278]|uniref:B12-binding domain-containing radical SAM protein n=1 Tax=Streptomyces sp. NBC_01278 TaxID=2903809 RepID=UPI002E355CBF|nr:radical SAM protein [Streptomyces sp. NBC_01278]